MSVHGICHSRGIDQLKANLAEARSKLADVERRWDNYSGNNPNKYQAELYLRGLVRVYEQLLERMEATK